jgi:hypothetical protein
MHDLQKLGRNRHPREHAHVATTGVATRNTADCGPDCAKNDANDLADRRDAFVTTNRKREHEPMCEDMPSNGSLTEDVGAFEMNDGPVQAASPHQLPGQHDFVVENFLVRSVHGRSICNSGASSPVRSDLGVCAEKWRGIERPPDTWLADNRPLSGCATPGSNGVVARHLVHTARRTTAPA